MFAVIETGGKQYKVQYGDVIYVESASVTGKVLKNGKAKKVTILTYKPKKGEKRKMGHRQPYTKIQIESVQG